MAQHPTNVEYQLSNEDSLVTKTDLNGVITYANLDFERASGFDSKELIGHSHSIVHHPDMPSEVFADLWQTLKELRTWVGVIKNLRKDGSYFWAMISITPDYEDGKLIGYLASRSKATKEQINFFESKYKLLKQGRDDKLKIKNSFIYREHWQHRILFYKRFTIKQSIYATIGLFLIVTLGLSGVGLMALTKSYKLHESYFDKANELANVSYTQKLLMDNYSLVVASSSSESVENINKIIQQIETNIATLDVLWDDYLKTDLKPEEKLLVTKFISTRGLYVDEGLKAAIVELRAHNLSQVVNIVNRKITPLYQPIKSEINDIAEYQVMKTQKIYAEIKYNFAYTFKQFLVLIIVGFAFSVLMGIRLYRSVSRPLREAAYSMRHSDNRDIRLKGGTVTEISDILDAFKTHQIRNRFFVAETQRVADQNLRVRIGLDSVTTSVTVADQNRNIIYYNKAAENLLRHAEADIRKELPDFSVSNLMGANIDAFHKDPEHQKKILGELRQRISAKINIGGRSLVVIANPVINERGEHLGSTAEWHDRTEEVMIENEVTAIIDSIGRGDFSKRIDETGKEDFVLQISQSINRLVKECSESLNETVNVLNALSRGDLTKTIDGDYSGTFEELKNDVNATVESLRSIVQQIQDATANISTGSREIAAGNNDLSQRTEEQATSIEETASSMEELTSTVKHNAENAKEASKLAIEASQIAERGVDVVSQVVKTMGDINESSRKIGDIILVIDDIAFQTNILALNAAVEAARAGDQGKGFAVVATEVRNLAQRAATAAGEIKNLINDSVTKVVGGTKLVTNAGETMEEIVTSIQGVTKMMSEITTASAEQSQGIEQVNQAVGQMDEVTQQNAALVEESAAAAESLEEQAQNLSVSVAHFNMGNSNPSRSTLKTAPCKTNTLAKVPSKSAPAQVSHDDWEAF
jgi:methyl-accepting chemotaxis protein